MARKTSQAWDNVLKQRGEQIRQAREARGWSQANLADAVGTTQQTIDRIERGVTRNSASIYTIREVLELQPYSEEWAAQDIHKQKERSRDIEGQRKTRWFEQLDRGKKVEDGSHIPIYSMTQEGILSEDMVDAIPRIFPVEHVTTAYGIISRDFAIDPIVRSGDIVIVNPNLPPFIATEAVFRRLDQASGHVRVLIRTVVNEENDEWIVSGGTGDTERLSKDDWRRVELIVAKISRVR